MVFKYFRVSPPHAPAVRLTNQPRTSSHESAPTDHPPTKAQKRTPITMIHVGKAVLPWPGLELRDQLKSPRIGPEMVLYWLMDSYVVYNVVCYMYWRPKVCGAPPPASVDPARVMRGDGVRCRTCEFYGSLLSDILCCGRNHLKCANEMTFSFLRRKANHCHNLLRRFAFRNR